VITVGYSLVYLADPNPYFMLHFHVNFFLRRIHYAVFEQPVTEICSVQQLIEKWSTKIKLMLLLTKGSNEICHNTGMFLWM